jgi:hypothetical protein
LKSVNFKRQGSDIRVISEKILVKKKRQWDRIIYFIVLFLLLASLVYFIFSRLFYVKADGHILYENVNVRLLEDSRIIKYYVNVDDSIKIGDTLFSYVESSKETESDEKLRMSGVSPTGRVQSNNDWIEREIITLEQRISLNKVKVAESQQLMTTYQRELTSIKSQVQLGVIPQSHLQNKLNDITRLDAEQKRLEGEINEYQITIEKLESKRVEIPLDQSFIADAEGRSSGDDNKLKFYISPFEGSVNRIYTRPFETCLKSEISMSMHRNSPVFVRAYFDQSDIDHFEVGDRFEIVFPNGETSEGIVQRLYYSTIPLPEEYQERFEPTTRTIAGDIYPSDSMEEVKWKSYYKMGVQVKKFKY